MPLKEIKSESGLTVYVTESVQSNVDFYDLTRKILYCYVAFGERNRKPVVYFGSQARHEEFLSAIQQKGKIDPLWYGQLAATRSSTRSVFYQFGIHNSNGSEAEDSQFIRLLPIMFSTIHTRFLDHLISIHAYTIEGKPRIGFYSKDDGKFWQDVAPE